MLKRTITPWISRWIWNPKWQCNLESYNLTPILALNWRKGLIYDKQMSCNPCWWNWIVAFVPDSFKIQTSRNHFEMVEMSCDPFTMLGTKLQLKFKWLIKIWLKNFRNNKVWTTCIVNIVYLNHKVMTSEKNLKNQHIMRTIV